jgi:hypothetical protein
MARKKKEKIIAYKATDKEFRCKGFLFEVGKTYTQDGKLGLCSNGFHFCRKISNCFEYYPFSEETNILEVEILGDYIGNIEDKECTNKIQIIRVLAWEEVLRLCNSGDCNSGNWNSGNWNSGNRNSGDWNSGNWNSGNRNSGVFNINNPDKYRVFGKWITKEKYYNIYFPSFLQFDITSWVSHDTATQKEKEKYKVEIETCGGFLKKLNYKEAFLRSWKNADKDDRIKIKDIPHFDKQMFFEVSGIDIDKD